METSRKVKNAKVWSRKGYCPMCDVGTGSKHNKKCIFKLTPTALERRN